MATVKSPCVWFSRPLFVLLFKPKVRTSPQRYPAPAPLDYSRCTVGHCNADTSDYIKVSRYNPGIIMCCPSVSQGERSSSVWDVLPCRESCEKGRDHSVSCTYSGFTMKKRTQVKFWCCNALKWFEESPCSARVSCQVRRLLLRATLCALHNNYRLAR